MGDDRAHRSMREGLENRRRNYTEHICAGRRGRIPAFEFPPELATDVPPFTAWLDGYVKDAIELELDIDEDLVRISQPPSRLALRFSRMWAYGNHYRTDNEQFRRRHSTYDSAICTIFTETVEGGSGLAEATLQYVGILKDILVVSFGALKVTLMRASWIPMHNADESPNRLRDQYGFFLVKQDRRLPAMEAPYVFPSQVSQVMHRGCICWKCTYATEGIRGLGMLRVLPTVHFISLMEYMIMSLFVEVEQKLKVAIVVVCNILTRCLHCVICAQVFFIPDSHDRTWKVVVQKEARSRRVIEVGDEAILNGAGVYNDLEADCVNDNGGDVRGGGEADGELVHAADVQRAEMRFIRGERARARALEERMTN